MIMRMLRRLDRWLRGEEEPPEKTFNVGDLYGFDVMVKTCDWPPQFEMVRFDRHGNPKPGQDWGLIALAEAQLQRTPNAKLWIV